MSFFGKFVHIRTVQQLEAYLATISKNESVIGDSSLEERIGYRVAYHKNLCSKMPEMYFDGIGRINREPGVDHLTVDMVDYANYTGMELPENFQLNLRDRNNGK